MKEWPKYRPMGRDETGTIVFESVIPADLGRELYEALAWQYDNGYPTGEKATNALARYEREVGS